MDLNDIRSTSPETVNLQGTAVPQPTHRSYRSVIVAVVALIALIAVGFLLMRSGSRPAAYDDAGNPVYKAEEGALIEGFPKELLLEQDAVITGSSRIDYTNRGESLPYAQYVSQKPYAEIINEYRRLLQEQGWVVLRDAAWQEGQGTSFYAKKGETETVTIVLTPTNDGTTQVQVAYSITTSTN